MQIQIQIQVQKKTNDFFWYLLLELGRYKYKIYIQLFMKQFDNCSHSLAEADYHNISLPGGSDKGE